MPKLSKQFHLEITVEQFLNACSLLELQEVELLLDSHIRRAEEKELREAYATRYEYRAQVDKKRTMFYSSEEDEKIEPFTNEYDPNPKPLLGWKELG